MLPIGEFIHEQRLTLPICVSKEICAGKTYIVTGSNTGLGYYTQHLVLAGARHVIIAVRSTTSGLAAQKEIEASTGTQNVIEVWPLDLSSYASIKTFADRAKSTLERVDALIENAGVAIMEFQKGSEGHEMGIQVNVYGTFYLLVLLLGWMGERGRKVGVVPTVTIVISEGYTMAKKELDATKQDVLGICDKPDSNVADRYVLTKLLQFYIVRHLASILPISRYGVVINSVNPGMCKTKLARSAGFVFKTILKTAHLLLGRTAEEGSRTLLFAAVAAGEQSHGTYTSACEIQENNVPDWAKNEEAKVLQKRIWDGVAKELERVDPGCVQGMLQSR